MSTRPFSDLKRSRVEPRTVTLQRCFPGGAYVSETRLGKHRLFTGFLVVPFSFSPLSTRIGSAMGGYRVGYIVLENNTVVGD